MANPAMGETKSAALYGSTASIPDRGLLGRVLWSYLDALYVTKGTRHEEPSHHTGNEKVIKPNGITKK